MELELAGGTAIVTGASRGIGLATARALHAEGMDVVGAARTVTPELAEVCARTVAVDLARPEGAAQVVAAALEETGRIDLLVNNVGAGDADTLALGGFLETDDRQWEDLFAVNLYSAVRACRAALPSLLERGGSIVTISSVNARVPATGPVGYSEAKAALTAFSKRLSEEFGPRGVRVNTVSPGPVGTGLWLDPEGFGSRVAAQAGASHQDFLAAMPQLFGLTAGRITEPEAVASLVAFLASPRSLGILGSDIAIDGGVIKSV